VLREEHDFRGYIHLKTIPDASARAAARAGRYADRLSINIELPTDRRPAALAPEKDESAIKRSMARLRVHIDDAEEARREAKPIARCPARARSAAKPPPFAPAGQSTQMIVGADATDDRTILATSASSTAPTSSSASTTRPSAPSPTRPRALPLQSRRR
jgi:predicted DNA-binding helix-hairpin-helix protein